MSQGLARDDLPDVADVFSRAGLDTVSASRVPLDLWGHGFVASAQEVIGDLKQLLWLGSPPAKRNLIAVPDSETAEFLDIARLGVMRARQTLLRGARRTEAMRR